MTRAFSDDLRSRVLAASRGGMSARSAAARFGNGISTAIAWIASARAGRLTPAKQGRRGGSRLDAHEDFIVNTALKKIWTREILPDTNMHSGKRAMRKEILKTTPKENKAIRMPNSTMDRGLYEIANLERPNDAIIAKNRINKIENDKNSTHGCAIE